MVGQVLWLEIGCEVALGFRGALVHGGAGDARDEVDLVGFLEGESSLHSLCDFVSRDFLLERRMLRVCSICGRLRPAGSCIYWKLFWLV